MIIILVALLLLAQPSGPACSLSTFVNPQLGPDWIFDTLTNLDPTDLYTVTLVQPDGSVLQTDSDYGQAYDIVTFDVVTFQSGTYTAFLNEVGHHKILTSCSVAVP